MDWVEPGGQTGLCNLYIPNTTRLGLPYDAREKARGGARGGQWVGIYVAVPWSG